MPEKKFSGEKVEGYELLKPGHSFAGPRTFKRAKDVVIKRLDKTEHLKNINKNSYVPIALIPKDFNMSCFEGQPVAKKPVKQSDKDSA